MNGLDKNIQDIERAFHKARAKMDELEAPFSFPANCCPSCACGTAWKDLAKKREAQAFVLARLLMKRNLSADLEKAEELFRDYGWYNSEWKQWRDSEWKRRQKEII